jgi:hypothetical protein
MSSTVCKNDYETEEGARTHGDCRSSERKINTKQDAFLKENI